MAGNWTPGPGKTGNERGSSFSVFGADNTFIAEVSIRRSGDAWTPGAADARLIAAAPDLYDALAAALADSGLPENIGIGAALGDTSYPPWVWKARAALSKARGDQPDSDPQIPNSGIIGA